MDEILVDQEGYDQFYSELEKLKKALSNNATEGSEAYKDAVGDGWHDNFAFEEAMRQERNIASRIDSMLKNQKNLKLIAKINYDNKVINLGDILKITIKYSDDDIETKIIRLTGKYLPDWQNLITEVSLNSPLGKAIYLKNIKKPITYLVNNNNIEVRIIERII